MENGFTVNDKLAVITYVSPWGVGQTYVVRADRVQAFMDRFNDHGHWQVVPLGRVTALPNV